MSDILHHIEPKTDFEKLMIAEAVVTDMYRNKDKLLNKIDSLKDEINKLKEDNQSLNNQLQSANKKVMHQRTQLTKLNLKLMRNVNK